MLYSNKDHLPIHLRIFRAYKWDRWWEECKKEKKWQLFLIQESKQQKSNSSFFVPSTGQQEKGIVSQMPTGQSPIPTKCDHSYLGCLRSIRMRSRSLASSILRGSLWEKLWSWSKRVQRFCSFIRSPDLSCFPTETQCTPPGKQPNEEKNG